MCFIDELEPPSCAQQQQPANQNRIRQLVADIRMQEHNSHKATWNKIGSKDTKEDSMVRCNIV